MTLNTNKTQTITISLDKTILTDNPVTLLGIKIDQRLTWAGQMDQVCSRASSGLYALKRLIGLIGEDVLRMAYFSLVHSHLTYGILLWGRSADFDRAFIMQKRSMRVLMGRGPREHCRPLFKQLILSLPSDYIYVTCLHIKKLERSLRVQADVHSYNTRGSNLLLITASRTCASEKNKINLKIYNHLPNKLKLLTFNFKAQLQKFLLAYQFYSVEEYYHTKFID